MADASDDRIDGTYRSVARAAWEDNVHGCYIWSCTNESVEGMLAIGVPPLLACVKINFRCRYAILGGRGAISAAMVYLVLVL